jgi:Protein of unknown function (DUF2958)
VILLARRPPRTPRGADHVPVVKFFSLLGEGVRLAAELNTGGDTLFGLADLGYPELGSFSLEELTSILLPFGMPSSAATATARASSWRLTSERPKAPLSNAFAS